ncbi:isochorismatase family protein [Streptomyces sp. NPDC088810]|uniref:isochorismatase family protein n=1 Tax=Streptomyces sp. NPDC088810 TaxID=3365904 RepID=UPI0038078134
MRTALVVIDMVPLFAEANPYVRGIVPNIGRLAGALRTAGGPVAWVLPANEAPLGRLSGEFYGPVYSETFATTGAEAPLRSRLWHALDVRPDDLVVEKTAYSAFFPGCSPLPGLLAERHVDTIVITGTVTNVCCESSARDAATTGMPGAHGRRRERSLMRPGAQRHAALDLPVLRRRTHHRRGDRPDRNNLLMPHQATPGGGADVRDCVGDRAHLNSAHVNLDTHIDDVLAVLATEEMGDAVLVGHSYGGMVITGAADRAPSGVVRRLAYCDAYVPEDGQSCWDLTSDAYRSLFLDGAAANGYAVQPPSGSDPRVRAHPLASYLQRIRLDAAGLRDASTRDDVYLSGWDGTPFTAVRDRLANDPTWRVHTLDSGHDVCRDALQEFSEILLLGE